MLELQFSLTPERPDQGRAPLHGAQAIASTGFEVVEVGGATVAEFVMLQMTPDVFGRIELRCIGRQLLDLDGAVQCFQVVAHESRAMRGQSVPDDQQRLAELLPESMQELDDLRTLDGPWKQPEVETPESDAGDDRQLVPVEVVLQDRRLALGSPSAHTGWAARSVPTRR
jgi:hypothetical protein